MQSKLMNLEEAKKVLSGSGVYMVAAAFNYPQISFQSQLRFEFQLNAADHAIEHYYQVVDL